MANKELLGSTKEKTATELSADLNRAIVKWRNDWKDCGVIVDDNDINSFVAGWQAAMSHTASDNGKVRHIPELAGTSFTLPQIALSLCICPKYPGGIREVEFKSFIPYCTECGGVYMPPEPDKSKDVSIDGRQAAKKALKIRWPKTDYNYQDRLVDFIIDEYERHFSLEAFDVVNMCFPTPERTAKLLREQHELIAEINKELDYCQGVLSALNLPIGRPTPEIIKAMIAKKDSNNG